MHTPPFHLRLLLFQNIVHALYMCVYLYMHTHISMQTSSHLPAPKSFGLLARAALQHMFTFTQAFKHALNVAMHQSWSCIMYQAQTCCAYFTDSVLAGLQAFQVVCGGASLFPRYVCLNRTRNL
jgi:hypothetical protein